MPRGTGRHRAGGGDARGGEEVARATRTVAVLHKGPTARRELAWQEVEHNCANV